MGQRFRPAARIRRTPEFTRVFQKGRKYSNRYFTLHILPSAGGVTRLGVIASRHTGRAVERNRAKRLLREAFRRLRHRLPPGLDLVAVAKSPIVRARLRDVEIVFLDAMRPRKR
ncbi:MAG: ribonuclease P protein component [bacterium]